MDFMYQKVILLKYTLSINDKDTVHVYPFHLKHQRDITQVGGLCSMVSGHSAEQIGCNNFITEE